MTLSTHSSEPDTAQRPRRHPFARLRLLDVQWVLLKPVFKGRQMVQPERLARVTASHERVAMLELYRLEAKVDGEQTPDRGNQLEVMVDHRNRRVRFGPTDELLISPPGRGLGGFMLSQLIDWLQVQCPYYLVTPLPLVDKDLTDQARQARDRLLQRAGFELHYPDRATGLGRAQIADVAALIPGWNTDRLQPCQVSDLLAQLREQESLLLRQQAQTNTLRATLESYQRTDAGHRFAIGCLLVFSLFQALLLFWVVMR